jgi:excinuclease ABC subunit C
MKELIRLSINNLPDKPGVYLLKNDEGKIIYVGKAKNLKKRVGQYFLRPQSGKVAAMVFKTASFDTIITNSEKEALILEMNLIHEHYPRYNILLKEGGHYPYIALRKGNDPVLKISRNNKDRRYKYFGPFPHSSSAYRTMDLLNKIFPLRKCNVMPKTACLYYHLNQCLAPCINDIDESTYELLIKEIESFLNGNVNKQLIKYKQLMTMASDQLNYELAGDYKKILDDIETTVSKQHVEIADKIERDIWAYAQREGYLSLSIIVVRRGMLLGKHIYIVEQFGDINEQIVNLINQYYHNHPMPKEIIVSQSKIANLLNHFVDASVISNTKGKLYELTLINHQNAIQGLDDHFMTARLDDNKMLLLETLGKRVDVPTPYRIEMFDNSHLQGTAPIGALVVFINGEPVKRLYRLYHIKQSEKGDDVAMMKEVVFRRYKRLVDEKQKLPDLIIVDGGLLQVKAAIKALKQLALSLPVFGLFKNERHQTKGLVNKDGRQFDLTSEPSLFFFLMRLQDEVHRYAITFHQKTRKKIASRSLLDGIEGLGIKRREIINRSFKTLDELKQAGIDDLSQLIPKQVAIKLYDRLHNTKDSD